MTGSAIRSDLQAVLLALSYEQLRLLPYDDGVGVLTTGWGHRILPGEDDLRRAISRERANDLFVADWRRHERGVLQSLEMDWSPFSSLQIGALTCLAFNIGVTAFAGSSVVRAIRVGALGEVPAAMRLWNKGRVRGKLQVLPGLVKRRDSEARLWEKGSP